MHMYMTNLASSAALAALLAVAASLLLDTRTLIHIHAVTALRFVTPPLSASSTCLRQRASTFACTNILVEAQFLQMLIHRNT